MHLIDDIDGVLTYLRGDTYFLNKGTNIFHRVVGRGIKFVDIKTALFVERDARLTGVAGVKCVGGVQTVDGFGEDTCAGCLTYATRTAEQIRVCQMVLTYSVLQGLCQVFLPHYRLKCSWSILTCRNDILLHITKFSLQRYNFFPTYAKKNRFFRCFLLKNLSPTSSSRYRGNLGPFSNRFRTVFESTILGILQKQMIKW